MLLEQVMLCIPMHPMLAASIACCMASWCGSAHVHPFAAPAVAIMWSRLHIYLFIYSFIYLLTSAQL
jgi:hypothetical protein